METRSYNVYKFSELSDELKKKVLENKRDINVDFDSWYDFVEEDAKECGKRLGITIEKIYFSGFSSQGDGACFEGSYSFKKDAVSTIKEYAPKDEKLHRIAYALDAAQKANGNTLFATVKHSGHYYHSRCTTIHVYLNDEQEERPDDITQDTITELLRDFMNWTYSQLEKAYEDLTTDEAVIGTIEANDYMFTDDGKID